MNEIQDDSFVIFNLVTTVLVTLVHLVNHKFYQPQPGKNTFSATKSFFKWFFHGTGDQETIISSNRTSDTPWLRCISKEYLKKRGVGKFSVENHYFLDLPLKPGIRKKKFSNLHMTSENEVRRMEKLKGLIFENSKLESSKRSWKK